MSPKSALTKFSLNLPVRFFSNCIWRQVLKWVKVTVRIFKEWDIFGHKIAKIQINLIFVVCYMMGGIKREVKIITSARPSARPSFFPLVFLGLVHFFFLKLCMVLGSHMEMCMTEPNFCGKILFQQNWPIMVKKWPKNGFFGLFRKTYSLVLSVNDLEWNYFWPFSILRKLHMLEKPAISCIIFWDFLMFYQIFFSPQIKWWAIITYKHGIFELPHELLDDVRLRILEN